MWDVKNAFLLPCLIVWGEQVFMLNRNVFQEPGHVTMPSMPSFGGGHQHWPAKNWCSAIVGFDPYPLVN